MVDHPISQPSLDISPIWTPIIAAEVKKKKLQLHPVEIKWENCFFFKSFATQRIYLSSHYIYSDSALVLGLIRAEILTSSKFVLTLADGLCCAWFVYPILPSCRCPEIGTSSIDWVHMSRFYLKTKTKSNSRNVVFSI
jgi:hypothetical protein